MREKYTVSKIYEDDFGCEERDDGYQAQVIVIIKSSGGDEFSVKQADAWMYEQEIREEDEVYLIGGKLKKVFY